ncbi:MAG: hypothetical protein ACI9FD_002805, partial [Gammaproteobacteria bacterium]
AIHPNRSSPGECVVGNRLSCYLPNLKPYGFIRNQCVTNIAKFSGYDSHVQWLGLGESADR